MLVRRAPWLLPLVVVVVAACATPRVFGAADDAAVRGILRAQQEAWNHGDLAGFMAGYAKTDDLVFTSRGQIHRGWQATFDRYRRDYGQGSAKMGHLDLEVAAVQPLGADGAVVLGRWKLTDGREAGGVFSVALARTADGWRIVHDHTSADAPKPVEAPKN